MPDGLQNGQSTLITTGSRVKLGKDVDAPIYVVVSSKSNPPQMTLELISRSRGYPEKFEYNGKPLSIGQFNPPENGIAPKGVSPYGAVIDFDAQKGAFVLTPKGTQPQNMFVYTPKGDDLMRLAAENDALKEDAAIYEKDIKQVTNLSNDTEYRQQLANMPALKQGYEARDGEWGSVTARGQEFTIKAYTHANEGFLTQADKAKLARATEALDTIRESSFAFEPEDMNPANAGLSDAQRANKATNYVMGEFQKTSKVYFSEPIPGHHKVGMVEKVGNDYFYTCYNGGDEADWAAPSAPGEKPQIHTMERYKLNVKNDAELKQFIQSKFDRIIEPRKIPNPDPNIAAKIIDPLDGQLIDNPDAWLPNPAYPQAKANSELLLGERLSVTEGSPQLRGNCGFNSNNLAVSEILDDQQLSSAVRTFGENHYELAIGAYPKSGLSPTDIILSNSRRQMEQSAFRELYSGLGAQGRSLYNNNAGPEIVDILPGPRVVQPVPKTAPPVQVSNTAPLSQETPLSRLEIMKAGIWQDDPTASGAYISRVDARGMSQAEAESFAARLRQSGFSSAEVSPAGNPGGQSIRLTGDDAIRVRAMRQQTIAGAGWQEAQAEGGLKITRVSTKNMSDEQIAALKNSLTGEGLNPVEHPSATMGKTIRISGKEVNTVNDFVNGGPSAPGMTSGIAATDNVVSETVSAERTVMPPKLGLAGWQNNSLSGAFNNIEPAAAAVNAPAATVNTAAKGFQFWQNNPARNAFNQFGEGPASVFSYDYLENSQSLADRALKGRYIRPMPSNPPIFKTGITLEEMARNGGNAAETVDDASRIARTTTSVMSKVTPVLESPVVKIGGNILGAATTAWTIFDVSGGREAVFGKTTEEKLLGDGVVGRTDSGYGHNGMKQASGILAVFPPAGLAASVLTAGTYAAGFHSVGQTLTETINVYNKGGESEGKLRQRWQDFADAFPDVELIRQGADNVNPSKYMAGNMVEFMKRYPDMARGGVFKVLGDRDMFNQLTHEKPDWDKIKSFILKTPMNDAVANYAAFAQENSTGTFTAAPIFGDQFTVPNGPKLFYPSGDTAFVLPNKVDFNADKLIQDYSNAYKAAFDSPLGMTLTRNYNIAGNVQSFLDDPKKKEQDRQLDVAAGTAEAREFATKNVTIADTNLKKSYDVMRTSIEADLNKFATNLQEEYRIHQEEAAKAQQQLRIIDSQDRTGWTQEMIDQANQNRQEWVKYGDDAGYKAYEQKLTDWLKQCIQKKTDEYAQNRDLILKDLKTSLGSFHFYDKSNGQEIGPLAPSLNVNEYVSDTNVIQLNVEEMIKQIEAGSPAPQQPRNTTAAGLKR